MRYFTDSPFERLMMEVPHGHSLAAEAAWRHEQQATGKPAAFSLTSKSERRSSLNSTLIIAEKPSVALAIAAVVGADKRKNGYLEGNGYLVSWCVGHLVSLAQPENYDLRLARWRRADLPILPDPWQYVPNEKTKKQLDLLCSLMNRPDIETIVCATDAGREGELIFRLVYDCCRCSKPVKRLWISSLEESAIREGMSLILKKPKTKNSIRKVYLPRTIADILKAWHTRQLELIDLLGADYQNYNLVLAQNSGKPYDSHQIYKQFKAFIHAHELPDVTFHSLRHSSVTYKLALNDGNIKLVQGDTGHTSSKLMLNTYAEIFDQRRKELAVRFEENFYAALQP